MTTLTIALLGQLLLANVPVLANPIQLAQNRDVFPGDWAYEALQNLSQNYGCITGYSDDTFRGERILTRYEFAAGLVSCIESMERRILEDGDFATREEWQEMQRFLQETSSKLDLQETRVETLEQRSNNSSF
ncbi:MAG: iron uptake porin [Cyanobacteria bacterium SBLK]|nr:iron uptake porin [Cyanobacteria bacterium SBLK]